MAEAAPVLPAVRYCFQCLCWINWIYTPNSARASLVTEMVKNFPAKRETLGWEDPLEKGRATHSGILAWRISWTEEPGGLQSKGLLRVGHDWLTYFHFHAPNSPRGHFCHDCLYPRLGNLSQIPHGLSGGTGIWTDSIWHQHLCA